MQQVILEAYFSTKVQTATSHIKQWFILYSSSKLAYFTHKTDDIPQHIIDLSTVHSLNIYIPQTKHLQTIHTLNAMNISSDSLITIKNIENSSFGYSFELQTNANTHILSCNDAKQFFQWLSHLRSMMINKILFEGWLYMKNVQNQTWDHRYFVVYAQSLEMYYFADIQKRKQKGMISLKKVNEIRQQNNRRNHNGNYSSYSVDYSSSIDMGADADEDNDDDDQKEPKLRSHTLTSSITIPKMKRFNLGASLSPVQSTSFRRKRKKRKKRRKRRKRRKRTEKPHIFKLCTIEQIWTLAAESLEEKMHWISFLQQLVFQSES